MEHENIGCLSITNRKHSTESCSARVVVAKSILRIMRNTGLLVAIAIAIALVAVGSAQDARKSHPSAFEKCKRFGWQCYNSFQNIDKGGVRTNCNECTKYCGVVKEAHDVAYCKWAISQCTDVRMCKNWGWYCWLAVKNNYNRNAVRKSCSVCAQFCAKVGEVGDVEYCKWACAQRGLKGKCDGSKSA